MKILAIFLVFFIKSTFAAEISELEAKAIAYTLIIDAKNGLMTLEEIKKIFFDEYVIWWHDGSRQDLTYEDLLIWTSADSAFNAPLGNFPTQELRRKWHYNQRKIILRNLLNNKSSESHFTPEEIALFDEYIEKIFHACPNTFSFKFYTKVFGSSQEFWVRRNETSFFLAGQNLIPLKDRREF